MSKLNLLRIGPSDMPAIFGADKYSSAYALAARLKGHPEPPRDPRLDFAGECGVEFESGVWRMFARRENLDPGVGFFGFSREHATRAWERYTPDVLVPGETPRNVQIKTINVYRHESEAWGPDGSDGVPDRIRLQVTAEVEALKSEPDFWGERGLDVHRITHTDVVALTHGDGFGLVRYRVPYLPALGEMIVDAAASFWRDYALTDRMPDLDHTGRCTDVLEALYPRRDGGVLVATAEDEGLAGEMRRACFDLKRAEETKDRINNIFRARIGEAQARGIKGEGWSVSSVEVAGAPRWQDVARAIAKEAGLEAEEMARHIAEHTGRPYRKLTPRGFNKAGENI